ELALVWQDGIRTYRKQVPETTLFDSLHTAPGDDARNIKELLPAEKMPSSIIPVNSGNIGAGNRNHAIIETLIRSGHYDLAKKTLEANLQNDKFDVRSYIMLAVLALDLDEIDIAREAARKASFLEADSPYTVYTMSDVKSRMGD